MHTAEVVIVGGGIVGASIAWHLTEAGCRNVVIVERESHQGKGSTGKSMGGVRAQFATKPNIQMSLYSIPFYASFDERLGQPAGLSRPGLYVCSHLAEASRLPADQPGAAKIAGAEAGPHGDARRNRGHGSAASFRRHSGRQLLPDRWLRRSLQRDGWLHDLCVREGRDRLALDRGHGDSSRRLRHRRAWKPPAVR